MHLPSADLAAARRWLWLAIGVLLLAGAFALLLVLGRMPPFDALVTDPGFFRRCLVVHVQLSLVCWFHAFVAGLLMTLPRSPTRGGLAGVAPPLAAAGVLALGAAAFLPGTRPILSNYVPVVDHPLALLGLGLFGAGLGCAVLSRRLLPGRRALPGAPWTDGVVAAPGLRAAAVGLLLALATALATVPVLPAGAAPEVRYEVLFWGVGHVLQLVSVAAMLAVWLWLTLGITGRPAMSRRSAAVAFALLVAPWLVAPLLPAAGPWSATYKVGFTRLMQWCMFPVSLWVLAACVRNLWAAHRAGCLRRGDGRLLGLGTSAGLTLLGFVLGALIRDANTMVPAHYHAAIGAVTAAFMTASFRLLPAWGLPGPVGRLLAASRWQPALFGVGQAVFAVGFALAGARGMARKVYGSEQAVRSGLETLGLSVMGVGGLLAVAAGVLFLVIHVRSAAAAFAAGRLPAIPFPGGRRVRET